ncbi:4Fe-4S dicluster domain-containing protein [Roseomonas sp. NAR14]|uniref:4Fe-4S dicluster domain-containing protein n=1 Tax=Roseomonas acroporae TaxID=2937791 RepID=A0A9X1YBJ6_9PROT|nr:4Fe-4S dicluster domain-containing protein [Roseomonas acroporae]MCK8787086.1 4Fe-4S dicluster domain-containing protein [Roseomonas acroporae]
MTGGPSLPRRQAALALLASAATLTACGEPPEEIIPAVEQAEDAVPGVPRRFATALPLGGYGRGVVVTSHEGRPTKVAGNPDHPASLGATDVFAEAAVLSLYDPDRSRLVRETGRGGAQVASWEGFVAALAPRLRVLESRRGEGLALLTGHLTSPTLLRLIDAVRARFPGLRHHAHEAVGEAQALAGAALAFGRPLATHAALERATVVLALDADPLGPGPDQIRHARAFAARRAAQRGGATDARLYAAEPVMSVTGAKADHRLAATPGLVRDLAVALAARLGAGLPAPDLPPGAARFLAAAADDLLAHQGEALVLVGEWQPPALHALAHWINARLRAPVALTEPVGPATPPATLAELAGDLRARRVDTLLVLGANPAYDAPAALGWAEALRDSGAFSVHLGGWRDETAALCRWHLPETHPLEEWGDLRATDGTAAIAQPLITPLYRTRSAHWLLGLLLGRDDLSAREAVRETWAAARAGADGEAASAAPADRGAGGGGMAGQGAGGEGAGQETANRGTADRGAAGRGTADGGTAGRDATRSAAFERWWRRALRDGVVPGSAARHVAAPAPRLVPPPTMPEGPFLLLRPDAALWDGRFANNAWLQECPRPLTRQVWGNAALLAPAEARRLGLSEGDLVRLTLDGQALEVPVLPRAGMAPGVVALALGHGRRRAGAIGDGVGADAYALRRPDSPWAMPGLDMRATGRRGTLLRLQPETPLEGETATLFRTAVAPREPVPPSLNPPLPRGAEAWAMVIDTTRCIGCNACVVACQSENNVPVVGPEEIAVGRDMHWLRIDTYDTRGDAQDGTGSGAGPEADPRPGFQPVPCMHCEHAPCEPVCPVAASVHDSEGLNVQVYNRCIGTRFCQANCPYKVRRFNFHGYADGQEYASLGAPVVAAQRNPEVTVRARGVMEKCTYCVQRISAARRTAAKEDRPIAEGEVVTACQSACPAQAIAFGDLQRPDSEVSALRRQPAHYALLEHLGTRPRTTYLAALRHPNPALEDGA